MEMCKQKTMELNRETAMRLWNKTFGKETKAKDFAGRVMAKGAYNDRGSDFGWNVDHILPQSRGGVTADHNLVCCHILTNDEKADRFPCFKANGVQFEIRKVQNHYEIYKKEAGKKAEQEDDDVDFYDSAAGVRLFKALKGIQNKKRFVGTVFIYLTSVSSGAVIDFIEKLFCSENITFEQYKDYSVPARMGTNVSPINVKIVVSDYDMSFKSDISELLDKCVLLNTYLSYYFCKCGYIRGFDTYYRVDSFDRMEAWSTPQTWEPFNIRFYSPHNSMFINNIVLENTDAKGEEQRYSEYIEYNFAFSNLKKNLLKEADGK